MAAKNDRSGDRASSRTGPAAAAHDTGKGDTRKGTSRAGSEKPRRSHAWLLPTLVAIAAIVVIAAIVYTVATGQRFF